MIGKKSLLSIVLLLILIFVLTGCGVWNEPIESYEKGVILTDGVSITRVEGPGLANESGWRATLVKINLSNITIQWNDPSLVTRDKQPIGLTLNLTFARKKDDESIIAMYKQYNSEARDNESLKNLVLSRVPGVAKTITTKYTLDQMLGVSEAISGTTSIDRGIVANEVSQLLENELNEIYVDLVTVEIADIAPSAEYLAALNRKAQAQINVELAAQETILLQEQLLQEQAQTKIEVEKAIRQNQVNQETAKAYEESPQLLQLELLKRTADMLDESDVIIYVPEGANITSVLTQQSNIVPVE